MIAPRFGLMKDLATAILRGLLEERSEILVHKLLLQNLHIILKKL